LFPSRSCCDFSQFHFTTDIGATGYLIVAANLVPLEDIEAALFLGPGVEVCGWNRVAISLRLASKFRAMLCCAEHHLCAIAIDLTVLPAGASRRLDQDLSVSACFSTTPGESEGADQE
jgi:hypothetical protein